MKNYFRWHQWKPDPNVHNIDDEFAKYVDSRVSRGDVREFVRFWQSWNAEFPGAFKLITFVKPSPTHPNALQLRFWFGEPHSIRPDYVDSMGHNLIAGAYGGDLYLLHLLIKDIIDGRSFTKTVNYGVEVWRIGG